MTIMAVATTTEAVITTTTIEIARGWGHPARAAVRR